MKTIIALFVTLSICSACTKSQKSPSAPSDSIQQKLQQLAGSEATDCGTPKTQEKSDVQPVTDCAIKAAQNKQAFYVRYNLPGMTTAVAGDRQGKLYAVQTGANGEVESTPCPSEIRVAQSGRVTCYAPGSMGGMGMGGASPHGGSMQMPPPGMANPHEGSAMPSHASPQGTKTNP
ncbi:MAG: hypothetical protein ACM3JB_06350 [Acidobacteriaceae bacterium]